MLYGYELNYKEDLNKVNDIYEFYNEMGWNDYLNLSKEEIDLAMKESWYTIYVYSENTIIASGRVISDGIINGYICGVGVLKSYRGRGIGSKILDILIYKCKSANINIQLLCEPHLVDYYVKKDFKEFAVGMMIENRDNKS